MKPLWYNMSEEAVCFIIFFLTYKTPVLLIGVMHWCLVVVDRVRCALGGGLFGSYS